MDVQEPPSQKWAGKPEFMAEETLEDKIDIWFKVSIVHFLEFIFDNIIFRLFWQLF